jgi:hypothetical protein
MNPATLLLSILVASPVRTVHPDGHSSALSNLAYRQAGSIGHLRSELKKIIPP